MDIKIGAVIGNLRREKGITQEQFASEIGVSIPAVSKWETGQSYPDITLLPAIAEFFNVSIDALLNFSIMGKNNKLNETMKQLNEYKRTGDYENGLKLALEAVKRYPNDLEIMIHTADFLMFSGSSNLSTREQELYESISYFETVIKMCKDLKIIALCKRKIALMYSDLGKYEVALKLFEELQTDQDFAIDIADLKYRMGNINGAKIQLQEKLDSDMFSFGRLCGRLRNCYNHEDNSAMAIEIQKLLCTVWELMTWKTPNYYDDMISQDYSLLAQMYLKNEQLDEMWCALEKAVWHAVRFDKEPSYAVADVKFLGELKDRNFSNCAPDNTSKYLLGELKERFSQFSEDARYVKLIGELEKTAATKKEIGIWK